MRFGPIALADAHGAVLAHTLRCDGVVLKKGRRLDEDALAALRRAGHTEVIAARLDPDDVDEDTAAAAVAHALAGPGIRVAPAKTGRANLHAEVAGLVAIDAGIIDAVNLVDEAVTVATLAPDTAVQTGEMVATIKVIPFAVARATLVRTLRSAAGGDTTRLAAAAPALHLDPFVRRRVALVSTWLAGQPEARIAQGETAVRDRVERLGAELVSLGRCHHDVARLAAMLAPLFGDPAIEVVLVLGASAIVDRADVIPTAIEAVGGTVEHFGMPVDPGNLILVARHGERPVIGVPSCARSPKRSGFDMVLERALAGRPHAVMRMGVGGLLPDIPSRPGSREPARERSRAPTFGAVVLAAGSSRRMGPRNKLLVPIDGLAMVARALDAVLAAGPREVIVVTGHEADAVRAALADRPVRFVHNPAHATGLASSLAAGVAALGDVDAALVALGDMPWVKTDTIARLAATFDPDEGRAICVPTFEGKRGNPVLWARRFFPEILALGGDQGAKELLQRHADEVTRVAVDDPGVLVDIDTEAALEALAR